MTHTKNQTLPQPTIKSTTRQIETIAVGCLETDIHTELKRRFQESFGHVPYQWANPDWYVLAKQDQFLIGSLGIFDRRISVNGNLINVAGIGGVITHSQWRGQGVARALLMETNRFIQENLKYDFGLLICREEVAPVYQKSGWYIVEGSTRFEQPGGQVLYPKLTMVCSLTEKSWPEGEINLCGLPW